MAMRLIVWTGVLGVKYLPCWKSGKRIDVILTLGVCLSAAALPYPVEAGTSATVELVALLGAGPADVVTTLPTPQPIFAPGTTFFVEVWAQTGNIDGLSSVSIDVAFDAGLATVVSVTHSALFFELQNGVIDNTNGLVDDLSGSHFGPCSDHVAVAPDWGRVAIIELAADALGSMSISSRPTDSLVFGTAVCGVSDLDPANITYGAVSVIVGDLNIPAVSEWGLIVMFLLVLVAGTLVYMRRRSALA